MCAAHRSGGLRESQQLAMLISHGENVLPLKGFLNLEIVGLCTHDTQMLESAVWMLFPDRRMYMSRRVGNKKSTLYWKSQRGGGTRTCGAVLRGRRRAPVGPVSRGGLLRTRRLLLSGANDQCGHSAALGACAACGCCRTAAPVLAARCVLRAPPDASLTPRSLVATSAPATSAGMNVGRFPRAASGPACTSCTARPAPEAPCA